MRVKKFKFRDHLMSSNVITCDDINSFVSSAGDINPGAIKLNRHNFDDFIRQFGSLQFLPVSDKPYMPHIPTAYGVLPIYPSDKVPFEEIFIEPKVDVDEEFEKIVLKGE